MRGPRPALRLPATIRRSLPLRHGRQVVIVAGILTASLPAYAADIISTWNGSTANWTSNNWSSSPLFPNNGNGGFTYDAIVNAGAVTLNQNITIEDLSFGGGTITGSNNLDVLGDMSWTAGQFSGSGTTTIGGGTISGAADKLLQSRTLNIAGDVTWSLGEIGRPSMASLGTVIVESGATFTSSGLGPAGNRGLDANVQINSGGRFLTTQLHSTWIAHVVFHASGGTLINNGIVEAGADSHLSFPGGSGNGSFIVRNNATMVALLNDASEYRFTGDVILDNGSFDIFVWNGGNIQFLLPSTLRGTGVIQSSNPQITLTNSKEIAPGQSIGELELIGDYEQAAEGLLTIEVEGSSSSEFDRFRVSGHAALGGTLRIDASNYGPSNPGATMEILPAGSLSGTFESVETIGNDNIFFRPLYDYVGGGVSLEELLPGDMNHDEIVDDDDFTLFAYGLMNRSSDKFFAKCSQLDGEDLCDLLPQQGGDFSRNGILDFDDITGFRSRLSGMGLSSAALAAALERYSNQVPEPGSAVLTVLGGAIAGLVRRGRRTYGGYNCSRTVVSTTVLGELKS